LAAGLRGEVEVGLLGGGGQRVWRHFVAIDRKPGFG
jgi:hypothetical protein